MAIKRFPNDFDPENKFIVARSVRVGGQLFDPGDLFDKRLATTRTLRQLYEQRLLNMEPWIDDPVEEEDAYTGPKFEELPKEALVSYINENGGDASKATPRIALIKKAKLIYEELQESS